MAKLGPKPNSDDSTLRIRSDIGNEEDRFPSEATYMEELVQQLCDSALLDRKTQTQIPSGFLPPPQPPILPEPPTIQFGGFDPNLGFGPGGNAGGFRSTGVAHSVYASDQRGYRADFGPRNPGPFIKPGVVAPQYEGGRVRGYQEQNQNWNPVYPPRVIKNGTGVFFPRMHMQPPAMQEREKSDFKHEENQNRMPVKKSSVEGNQSKMPAKKSSVEGNQSKMPVKKSSDEGNQSKMSVKKSSDEGSTSKMPVKKSGKKNKKKASAGKGVKATSASTELELGLPQEWTY